MPTPETRTEHEARAAAGAKAGDDPGSPGGHPELAAGKHKSRLSPQLPRRAGRLFRAPASEASGLVPNTHTSRKADGALPDRLFEQLLAHGVMSSKALANVALAFRREEQFAGEVERCPYCGEVLRVREHLNKGVRDAITAWLAEGAR
jgi:hypothetical protein